MKKPRLVFAFLMISAAAACAENALVGEYTGSYRVTNHDLTEGTQELVVPALGWVVDVKVDAAAEKLYWIEGPRDILRANLDGSAPEVIVSGFWLGVGSSGLALDLGAGHLYWNDLDTLWRSDLDGTNMTVITGPDRINLSGGIDLDIAAGKIYYSGVPQAAPIDPIYRCNIGGGGVETIWDHPTILVGNLALDNEHSKIYFSDSRGTGLYRVDKAGLGLTQIHPSADVCGISVDEDNDTLYWIDSSSRGLWRSGLNGSNPTRVLYTSPAIPTSVAMLPEAAAPTLCGDCSANQSGPDIVDALVGAQLAASLTVAASDPAACDVNGSGTVDVLDSLVMAQRAVQLPATLRCN